MNGTAIQMPVLVEAGSFPADRQNTLENSHFRWLAEACPDLE